MNHLKQTWITAILTLLVAGSLANAQTSTVTAQNSVAEEATKLIEATQQYKTSSRELLAVQEAEVTNAASALEELRALVAEGLVARVELETSEQLLAGRRAQLEATKKQITDSDHMIAEIQADQELAKKQASTPARLLVKPVAKQFSSYATILRYSGTTSWSLGSLGGVESFFRNTFGRGLPTSAVGQSATHNRLGYDHRHAVDVALHPDSAEGKSLINYLQNQGIPFLAFRAAVPGVATGPHIHIGRPSHRL